jgi:hypothetical protein
MTFIGFVVLTTPGALPWWSVHDEERKIRSTEKVEELLEPLPKRRLGIARSETSVSFIRIREHSVLLVTNHSGGKNTWARS